MIYLVLEHLRDHLHQELPDCTFQLNYLPRRDANSEKSNAVCITLLNIMESVSSRNPYTYKEYPDRKISRQRPLLELDLTIVISTFFKDYSEGLKAISSVIQKLADTSTFKSNNVEFTVEMNNLSMEQSIWQALSTNVLPNVVYRIRCMSVIQAADQDVSREIVDIVKR